MTKIGLYIALFGIGSIILNSFGYEFKILMWMGPGYGIRIGVVALGLLVAFLGYKFFDKKEEDAEIETSAKNTSTKED
jgi:hypothetical protein